MKFSKYVIILIIILAIISVGAVSATDDVVADNDAGDSVVSAEDTGVVRYYVDNNAATPGNGSQSSPFTNISAAIAVTNETKITEIYLADGVYNSAGDRSITINFNHVDSGGNLSIIGSGSNVVIDLGNSKNFLTISKNSVMGIENLTIVNGFTTSSGGSILNRGTLTVSNVSFINSTSSGTQNTKRGGAILNMGTLYVINSKFINCTATQAGAIYNTGYLYLENNTAVNVSARSGTGNYVLTTTTVDGVTLVFNNNATQEVTDSSVVLNVTVSDNGNIISGTGSKADILITFKLNGNAVGSAYLGNDITSITINKKFNGQYILSGSLGSSENIDIKTATLNYNIPGSLTDAWVSKDGDDDTGDGSREHPYATIEKAITMIYDGGSTIHMLNGTYVFNSLITTPSGLSIIGEEEGVIFDGSNSKFFKIEKFSSLTIKNITFVNSSSDQMIDNSGSLTVDNCIFENNTGSSNRFLIYSYEGELNLFNSIFRNNTVLSSNGWGILIFQNGETKIINTSFYDNKGPNQNSLIYIGNSKHYEGSKSYWTNYGALIENCTFKNNLAPAFYFDSCDVPLTDSVFSNNTAKFIVYFQESSSTTRVLNISNSNFTENTVDEGIIDVNKNVLDAHDNVFANNTGCIVYTGNNYNPSLIIRDNEVSNNSYNSYGNFVYMYSGTIDGSTYTLIFNGNASRVIESFKLPVNATLVDADGNQITGAVVNFIVNGNGFGSARIPGNGVAELSQFASSGNYTISGSTTAIADSTKLEILTGEVELKSEDQTVIYVDVFGNDDTGDGSENNPYASLSRAFKAIGAMNNTIYIKPGTYSGELNQNIHADLPANAYLEIIGLPEFGDEVIFNNISGGFLNLRVNRGNNFVVKDIVMENSTFSEFIGCYGNLLVDNIKFVNCTPFALAAANNASILNVDIDFNNGAATEYLVAAGHHIKLVNCSVRNVQYNDWQRPRVISGKECEVINSTFENIVTRYNDGSIIYMFGEVNIVNSTFKNNYGYSIISTVSPPTYAVDNNCIYNSIFDSNSLSNSLINNGVDKELIVSNCVILNTTKGSIFGGTSAIDVGYVWFGNNNITLNPGVVLNKVLDKWVVVNVNNLTPVKVGEEVSFVVNFTANDGSALNDTLPTRLARFVSGGNITVYELGGNDNTVSYVPTTAGNLTVRIDEEEFTFVVSKSDFELIYDTAVDYDSYVPYYVDVIANNKPVSNVTVVIKINGKNYNATTDEYGTALFNLTGLDAKDYEVSYVINESDKYNKLNGTYTLTINKGAPYINIMGVEGDFLEILVTEEIANDMVVKIDNVTYPATVDANKLKVNVSSLVPGNHEVTVSFPGSGNYNASEVSDTIYISRENELTNSTFFNFFDDDGNLRSNITYGELIFVGEFGGLGVDTISIDKSINLIGENAVLNDIGLAIKAGDLTVDNFTIILSNKSGALAAVLVLGDNVTVQNSDLEVAAPGNESSYAVFVDGADDFTLYNNTIVYVGNTTGNSFNIAVCLLDSDDADIEENTMYIALTSVPISYDPTTWDPTVFSEGLLLDGCDGASVLGNTINIGYNNAIGATNTIYGIEFKESDDVYVRENEIDLTGDAYAYAVVINGDDFTIHFNNITSTGNTYANCIQVVGPSSGVIDNNNLDAVADSVVYPIYEYSSEVEYTNNNITGTANSVYAIESFGDEAIIENNIIIANGNFTMGIASAAKNLVLNNNVIIANGTNKGTPTTGDSIKSETIGIKIVRGEVSITDNNITSTSNYTINATRGSGNITDNYLVANKLTGDASVSYPFGEFNVADNIPAMKKSFIFANDTSMYYQEGDDLEAILVDAQGNPLANENIIFEINGTNTTNVTDANGIAKIEIGLDVGKYPVTIYYLGNATQGSADTAVTLTVLSRIANVTNATFFDFFDKNGTLKDSGYEELIFVGEFSNLGIDTIKINRTIDLTGNEAILNDIGLVIKADNVAVDDFTIKLSNESNAIAAICVYGDNVTVQNSDIHVTAPGNSTSYAILVDGSDNFTLVDNNILYIGNTTGDTFNMALCIIGSDDVVVEDNVIDISLTSVPISYDPTTWEPTVMSEGILFDDCNNPTLLSNDINIYYNKAIGTYNTIYGVEFRESDEANVIENKIDITGDGYVYGIVMNGEVFTIQSNNISAEANTYANGIEIAGPGSGMVDSNNIEAIADSVVYPIYEYSSEVVYTNNNISGTANSVYAMELFSEDAIVGNNTIIANGNFTIGVASAAKNLVLDNNIIEANGLNIGTPTTGDSIKSETVGVKIVRGEVSITDNEIVSNSEFTINATAGSGNITDNYLVAQNLTGDASVSYPLGTYDVTDNVPAMDKSFIVAKDTSLYYRNGTKLEAKVVDSQGNPLANKDVLFEINGVNYTRTTDKDGIARIAINLGVGEYPVTVYYSGNATMGPANAKVTVSVLSTMNGTDITKIFKNGTQYYATFRDGQGNYLADGTEVTFNINGVMYKRYVNGNEGLARLNINLDPGVYTLTAINPVNDEMASNTVTVLAQITNNSDLVKYFRNDSQYRVKVLDNEGKVVGAGENVTFNINGVFYTRQTDAEGYAQLRINLDPGEYTITADYKGSMVSNNIKVLPIITATDLTKKQGGPEPFKATIVDGQGKPAVGQNVTFNINGVMYHRTSDSEGVARLNINLNAGEYIITSMYNNASIGNHVTVTN